MAALCQLTGLLLRDADKYIAFLNFNTSRGGLLHSSVVNHAAKLGLLFLGPLAKAYFHAPERSLASKQIVRVTPNVNTSSELLYNQFCVLRNQAMLHSVLNVPAYIIPTDGRFARTDPVVTFRRGLSVLTELLSPFDIYMDVDWLW
jgi:hypothetical protein